MYKKGYWIFSFMIILSLLLVASSTPETTEAPEPTEISQVEPTEAPVEEPEPTEAQSDRGAGKLILATTTSTNDSGLLDYILLDFESETGAEVDVIAVGTGQALSLGENGDADVLLVHARAREDAFMDAGHGVRREDVM
jgi:tungstate transport system substrate-binding protein